MAALIAPLIDKSARVLEIGCGTGQLTAQLGANCAEWVATDFSPKMVGQTRKRLHSVDNITFRTEDATSLTCADGEFEVVVIANVLHIIPEPAKALAEIARVLRPGGLLIAPTFIYDGHENRRQLQLMQLAGFRTYHRWSPDDYRSFIIANGFLPRQQPLIPASPLSNCLLIATHPE